MPDNALLRAVSTPRLYRVLLSGGDNLVPASSIAQSLSISLFGSSSSRRPGTSLASMDSGGRRSGGRLPDCRTFSLPAFRWEIYGFLSLLWLALLYHVLQAVTFFWFGQVPQHVEHVYLERGEPAYYRASSSEIQVEDSPSWYHPGCSQFFTPIGNVVSLRFHSMKSSVALDGASSRPRSASHACTANSSSRRCRKWCGRSWKDLASAVDTHLVRYLRPFITDLTSKPP